MVDRNEVGLEGKKSTALDTRDTTPHSPKDIGSPKDHSSCPPKRDNFQYNVPPNLSSIYGSEQRTNYKKECIAREFRRNSRTTNYYFIIEVTSFGYSSGDLVSPKD